MLILIDTQILLWVLAAPNKLPVQARQTIENSANVVLFSAVSIWEIVIKASLRRPDFTVDPALVLSQALAMGFHERAVTSEVALLVTTLPFHHRDPFDRLLVAQSLAEDARLMTTDRLLSRYSELVEVVSA